MNKSLMRIFTLFFALIGVAMAASTVDTFEGYTSTTSLNTTWEWTGVISGNSMGITLNTTGGSGADQAMQVDFSFSSGQTNPKGYTGRSLNNYNAVDWSAYDGINVWLKGISESGNTPQYVQIALHEGNGGGSGSFGDKMESAKVYLNNLNSAGEYVYLAFADFTDYGGFGGTRDNGILELDDIRSLFVFSRYDGTPNQTSSASFLVDDITVTATTVAPLVRNPYLQNVTQTSVKVMWGSNESTGKVFWGSTAGTYSNSANSSAFLDKSGVYIHTAVISGLTAGEKVYYYVQDGANGNFGYNDATFYATAAPTSSTPIRVAVYSDSQTDWKGVTHHSEVVNAMIPHNPDIILSCGDLAYDGNIPLFNNDFFSHAAPIQKNTAIYPTPGNHDAQVNAANRTNWDADIKNWRDLFDLPANTKNNTEDYYYFDYGDVRFIALNTVTTNYKNGNVYYDVTRNQLMKDWLVETLTAATQTWKIVYFHQQEFLDYVWDQGWATLFEQYGVQLVFYGHGHSYYPSYRNGVMYVQNGGGGGPLHEVPWWGFYNYYANGAFRDYHFTQVDVTTNNLSVKVYNEKNMLRHSYDLDPAGNLTNNVAVPPHDDVDDFENYADAVDFQETWGWYGGQNGGTLNRFYDTGGASGTSNVIRTEFSFPANSLNPYGYAGTGGYWKWDNTYTGLSVWVQATQTGPSHDFQIRLAEGSNEDKFVYSIPISSLNPNGQYIYPKFSDFVWYKDEGGAGANGVLDLDRIVTVFVGAGLSGSAATSGSSSIKVDDLNGYSGPILNDIDNFESYTSSASLNTTWEWTGVISGNSMGITLNTTGGSDADQAMQVDFSFSSGQTNPKGYTGRSLNNYNAVNWSGYDGISVWLKGISESGNTPQYVQIALHEGNGGGTGKFGDKMESAKVYLNTLNSAGEYVYLAFADFTDYGGFGGTRDNGILELDDIRSLFVFSRYDGTPNQTSSASFLVDDIQNYKNAAKIMEIEPQASILPERFALHQNYPNPFNPVTTIQYDLSDASDVQLIVYDLLGQEIATLVNDRKEAGYHKVLWNGRNQLGQKVSSGVYIYLLKAGDYVGTKKLLLIK